MPTTACVGPGAFGSKEPRVNGRPRQSGRPPPMHSITLGTPVLGLAIGGAVCLVLELEGEIVNVKRHSAIFDIVVLGLGLVPITIFLLVVISEARGRVGALATVRKGGNACRQALGDGTGEQL